MKIYLVTRNNGKIIAAKSVFDKYKVELMGVEKDYAEIQAATSLEIAKYTALEAAGELKTAAIREDHSLFIHALNLPGPYMAYIEKVLSPEKVIEICSKFGDNTGHFEVASVIAFPDGTSFEHVFQVPITFSNKIMNGENKSWNGIIRLNDEKRTISEYPEEERLTIWSQGYQKIAEFLVEKYNLLT